MVTAIIAHTTKTKRAAITTIHITTTVTVIIIHITIEKKRRLYE
jgi:hypothetical protein